MKDMNRSAKFMELNCEDYDNGCVEADLFTDISHAFASGACGLQWRSAAKKTRVSVFQKKYLPTKCHFLNS